MRMRQGKNFWIIPLLTALIVAAVGWWADGQLKRATREEIESDLNTTLNANVTALEIWMNNQKRIATALAEEPHLKTATLELLSRPASSGSRPTPNAPARQLLAADHFAERLRTLGYTMAQIVNTNLVVISENARGRGRIGQPVLEELQPKYRELFQSGEARIITPFKVPRPEWMQRTPPRERPTRPRPLNDDTNLPPADGRAPRRFAPLLRDPAVMQVAVPIKDDTGETRAALVLIINPNAEFTRILSVARSGESGETFAFDAEGVLLSESRFDDDLKKLKIIEDKPDSVSALNLRLRDPGGDLLQGHVADTNGPLMLMVERAVSGASGLEITPFRDYRGVPVVGAWRWLADYGFGVGTKLDAREAFHTLRLVRAVFLVLFLLLLLTSLTILLFSYSQVRVRRRLTEAELKARQLGQYKLTEKIGAGGMGSVYKAHHTLLRRETALKLLPPDKADPFSIQRFEQEVQLTCTLTHPNTIQVFDYGHTPDGIFYYAMEYLDGLNLSDLVTRYGPQPEERVIHILREVCGSLAEAHGRGLIHRDIKPANVFLCDRGGVPDSVKVLDFGLVRHFGPNATEANLPEFVSADGIVGTPNFIAPEAIQHPDAADARSDIYSVGVLAYFLLTGQYIFEGDTIAEVCRHHLNDTPDTPSQRTGKAFDPLLEALVMRCLAKNPAARPQSAAALAAALAECAAALRWTPERRAAWWAAHRQAPALPASVAQLPASSEMQKTVKIDFDERTP
jgi:eukaryotic-like serine/threonine-protein kinase